MAIPVFVVIAAALLVFCLLPLRRPWQTLVAAEGNLRRRIEALEQEKVSYLRAIQDVEFERKLRKVSDADFAELKEHYSRKTAETMKALERLHGEGEHADSQT
ncbi:MAG: hypothetical protein ACYC99_00265 [Candidatus Geothermincolia bacterium]